MISIITATYNRSYIIEALYQSLCRQTSFNLEWIVVDDGSNDDTVEKVSKWKEECPFFSIIILKQANGGKHVAINNGIQYAHGDYCFIVDSDDILSEDAIETITTWWAVCHSDPSIAAVSGLRGGIIDKCRIGGFPILPEGKYYIEAKNTSRRGLNLLGDKAEVYRTSLLKANPFKVFGDERFLSENTVWDELAYQGYKVRWYNKVIYYCEYLNDGLTKRGDEKEINNFKGFTYYTQQRIKCYNYIEGIIGRGYYLKVARKKGLSIAEAATNLGTSKVILYISFVIWAVKKFLIGKR